MNIITRSPTVIRENFVNNNEEITQKDVFNAIKKHGGPNWEQDYKERIYNETNYRIHNNLNEIAQNLAKNYNRTASIYNKQTDIINKHQDLVDNNTQKLNKQLDDLNAIQNEIALKSRIIELNEEMAEKKLKQKKMIIGFFVLLPLLLIPILMISYNLTTPIIGLAILFLMVLGYVIYLIVVYKMNEPKKFKPVKDKPKRKKSRYEEAIANYYGEEKERLRRELSEFAYGNCVCPEEDDGFDDLEGKLDKFKNKDPATMSLADYQELFSLIGCRRDLNDNDVAKWRTYPNIQMVINEIKNDFRKASGCTGTKEENEFCLPDRCSEKNYLLNANGPFMYYDGSAPPEQIYPPAIGSVDVNVEGKIMNLPSEISTLIEKVQNPITKLFFIVWGMGLVAKGINLNDPRFRTKLDIGELEIANSAPEPYWDEIKLPLVADFDTTIKRVCQKYNSERKDLGEGIGRFLIDTWYFFMNENIPNDIYNRWLKIMNRAIADDDDMEEYYNQFIKEIISHSKFIQKYGDVSNFIGLKLRDMANKLENSNTFAQADVTRL